jgi:hypothetical protein
MMRDFNILMRGLNYPAKPKSKPPERKDFPNNASWGVALDEHDIAHAIVLEQYKNDLADYYEKQSKLDEEFWVELYDELGWDKLPAPIASELRSRAWDDGHSSGYMEVYCVASNYGSLVDAILKLKVR